MDVDAYLRRRYEGLVASSHIEEKEDLDLVWPPHPNFSRTAS